LTEGASLPARGVGPFRMSAAYCGHGHVLKIAYRAVTERDFMDALMRDLFPVLRWEVVHFRPARTKHGWRTPVQGTMGKGWPDLILARPPRLIAAELKSDKGKTDPEQDRVLALLDACGLEVYVWRPRDLMEIADILR